MKTTVLFNLIFALDILMRLDELSRAHPCPCETRAPRPRTAMPPFRRAAASSSARPATAVLPAYPRHLAVRRDHDELVGGTRLGRQRAARLPMRE